MKAWPFRPADGESRGARETSAGHSTSARWFVSPPNHRHARARARVQFGQPIGKFQAIANAIAEIKLRLEAARLLVYRAAWLLDQNKNVILDAALAKLCVSESFVRTAETALRVFGGSGYMTQTGVERALRDAMASPIYSGTSHIQRNIIARWAGFGRIARWRMDWRFGWRAISF